MVRMHPPPIAPQCKRRRGAEQACRACVAGMLAKPSPWSHGMATIGLGWRAEKPTAWRRPGRWCPSCAPSSCSSRSRSAALTTRWRRCMSSTPARMADRTARWTAERRSWQRWGRGSRAGSHTSRRSAPGSPTSRAASWTSPPSGTGSRSGSAGAWGMPSWRSGTRRPRASPTASPGDAVLIGVVGDCTLDVTVGPPGPMSAGDARAQISLGPGGQGANVAVRLARAGARVRLVAALADDPAGRVLRGHLELEAVDVVAMPAQRTGMVVVLLSGSGGERMMLSDRVSADGDLATALAGCDWVHVSGYLLRDPVEAQHVVTALHAAAIDRVSVAGGSFAGW